MKRPFLLGTLFVGAILLATALTYALAQQAHPPATSALHPEPGAVGRYQLVVIPLQTNPDEPHVQTAVRLDTATGRCWRYHLVQMTTGLREPKHLIASGWTEISGSLLESIQENHRIIAAGGKKTNP
jgi:hypothetical protein